MAFLIPYVWALGIALFVRICLVLIRLLLVKHLKRNSYAQFGLVGILLDWIRQVPWYFFVGLGLFAGSFIITLPAVVAHLLNVLLVILVGFELIQGAYKVLVYLLVERSSASHEALDDHKKNLLAVTIKIVLWIIGILLILLNLGVEISPLLASLGIGGIAVGFALQNILADVFSSFSIFLEKPFKVGDMIKLNDQQGTVMDVSLKSTRIKTLEGDILVVPNKAITQASLHNQTGITRRRVKITLGIVYETTEQKLRSIPQLIEQIITTKEFVDFGRCVFKSYGISALEFEVLYHLDIPEYKDFLLAQQDINYEIFATFAREGLQFAYPTMRTIAN